MSVKPFFFDLDREQLKEFFLTAGEPIYRAEQVWKGVYQHLAKNPDEITALPKSLREKLAVEIDFQRLNPVERYSSSDRETVKTLFTLPDGARIETVLMHYDERETLCISSQAGCAMGCVFCATGQMGLKRSLTSGEIIEQVMHYARELTGKGSKVTNIVVMGMGEPFHNYDAVMGAINRLNDPNGMNLGARRFTISTVGVIPGLKKFTAEKSQVNLAVSLHAANDSLRNRLIPANRKYPLAELINACREYVETTGRRLTFEWALIAGVNDTAHDALELAALVKGLNCHVNLIPLNPTAQYPGAPTTSARAQEFKKILDSAGVACTIRLRRGIDIQAGCGQLAARHVDA